MNIFATIGQSATIKDSCCLIDRIKQMGEKHVRFNFSKHIHNDDFFRSIEMVSMIRDKYGEDLSIMVDIPAPMRKPRIFVDKSLNFVETQQTYVLTCDSDNHEKNRILVDVNDCGRITSINDTLVYSDGLGYFNVEKIISADTILIRPTNNFPIYSKKSLCINRRLFRNELTEQQINALVNLNPEYVCLSFVEKSIDIIRYTGLFPKSHIISKIESSNGINRIDLLSKYSSIMVARGDMLVYSDYIDLYNNQHKISESTQKNKKKLFFATGILNTLCTNNIPSQADIIDLYNIISYSPDGIVLNYRLALEKYESAFCIINKMLANIQKNHL